MDPGSVGRKIGTGVRVGSKMLRERSGTRASIRGAEAAGASRIAGEKTRAMGRASKRFGEALWGPFVHVSGVLWLEVTGLFFGIFAVFFAQNTYRLRHAYAGGGEHTKFLLYAAVTALFVYFTITSFYRARRKGKYARGRAGSR